MRARQLLTTAVLLTIPAAALADGLVYKLPKDGAKVTYDYKAVNKDPDNTADRKFDGTLSIASVGTATVDGQKCRWIEVSMLMRTEGREMKNRAKLLISEADIGAGKLMLANVRRGWEKRRDREPTKLDNPLGKRGHPIPAFLADPLKEVKKLPEEEIKTGIGKLKCKGLTGKLTYEQGDADRTDRFEGEYTVRLSDKSPFGVASCKIVLKEFVRKMRLDDTIEIEFTLKSVGKNAKSEIPGKE